MQLETCRFSRGPALAAAALVVSVFVLPAVAASSAPQVSGTYLEEEVVSDGETTLVKLWVTPDRLRFESPGQMAVVWVGGDNGRMMMIQHEQKMYMEFTAEQMRQMGQMMGGRMGTPPGGEAEAMELSEPPTFTRTGNTKMVGEWNAYEVRVEHPEQTGEVIMWFSEDVSADLRTMMENVASSVESMQNPMLGGMMGRDTSGLGMITSVHEMWAMMDVPSGFPVQIITSGDGASTAITLKAIHQGPIEASVFEAPTGYRKMQLPGMR